MEDGSEFLFDVLDGLLIFDIDNDGFEFRFLIFEYGFFNGFECILRDSDGGSKDGV